MQQHPLGRTKRWARTGLAVVVGLAAAIPLAGAPTASAAPTITTGGPFTYTEQAPAMNVGAGTSVSGGNFYDGKYIDFEIDGATADEHLALESVATANTTDGVVSVVGTTVYIGDGSQAIPVGSIDGTNDGQDGSKLRVTLGSDFQNPSFESGAVAPWTVMNQNIDLGVTEIAGYTVQDQSTYPTSCNGATSHSSGNCPPTADTVFTGTSFNSAIVTTYASDGGSSLRLWSTQFTGTACAIVHGPAAYSNAFDAASGDTLYFDWKAANGGDAFHVYGYLLNTATGAQTPVLDAMQIYDGMGETDWAQAAAVVPTTGTYRFVFVSGTFDASCGRVAGASLYLDNFQVYGSGKIDDAVWTKIAEKLTYENGSDDPAATRTINLTTANSSDELATGAITVNIAPVNDVPTSDTIEVQWENTNVPSPSFADLTGTLSFTDPDDASLTYDIVGGTAGAYDVNGGQYDVSFTGTYGTLYVDATTGAYRLVADTAAVSSVVAAPASEIFPVAANDGHDTGSADLRLGITLPPAPRNVTGVPDDGEVVVSWDPPSEMPPTLDGYVVTASPDGATCTTTGATTCTVTGLTNGTPYTFTVVPTTPTGNGSTSLPSSPVTPVGLPTAPQNVSGAAGDGRVLVSWDPPANDGGTPITDYTVTTSPGGATCSTTSRLDCTVLGLAVGSTYTFTVVATNAQGDSVPSEPISVKLLATTTTAVSLSESTIDEGGSVTATATVSGDSPSGTVEFFANGQSVGTTPVSGGVAEMTVTPPTFGSFTITAAYSGDSGNNPSTSSGAALNVRADAAASIVASDTTPAVGEEITFTATVTGNNPTGTVEFIDGATSLGSATLSGGQAQITTDALAVGLHLVEVMYAGDANNTSAVSSVVDVTVLTVAGATLATSDDSPLVGDEIALTATVTGDNPTGTVDFYDGATLLGTITLSGGEAQLAIDSLTAGAHSIHAVYSGNGANTGATTDDVEVSVRTTSAASVTVDDDNPVVGDEITFTATVTGNNPTGTVEFFDGITSLGTATLDNGTASISTSNLTAGVHSVTVQYGGDGLNTSDVSDPQTVTVRTVAGATLATSDDSPLVGDEITLTATVTGDSPTGTVEFFDGGTSLGTADVSGGEAQLSIDSLTAGAHSLHAVYGGDLLNTGATTDAVDISVRSTSGTSVSVDDAAPIRGDEITFTATVTGNAPTGTVEFFDGITSLGTATLDDGTASISTSNLTAGVHSVTVQYGGDSLNTSDVSDPVSVMVRTEATVAVSSSDDSPLVGDAVTVTATVIGNAPTGTVEFFDGGTSLGTAPVASGTAELVVPSFAAGTHSITAVYRGDAANVGATSGAVRITGEKTAASATVTFSPAEPLVGGSVTVTVTVTGRTPTGTVDVFVGGKRVGTANVVNGKATLQVTAAKAGAMKIHATYSGDAANKSVTAPTKSVTVAKHTASTDLQAHSKAGGSTVGQLEVMVGSEVTLTATVEGRSPTGTVEFLVADSTRTSGLLQFIGEGGGSLGTAPVVDGVATLTVDSLSIGVHSVVAEYSGDAQNLSSRSLVAQVSVFAEPKPTAPEPKPTTGGPVPVTGEGYEPGTEVKIWLDGEGSTLLGTAEVDANGSFSTYVTLPSTTMGQHSLVVTGTDALGTETSGSVPVEVTGTLPSTGSSSSGPVAQLALLLLVAGALLVVTTHRRRKA